MPWALLYGEAANYQICDFESCADQEVNGDSTNWLDEQGIPAVAILLPDYEEVDWQNNLLGLEAILAIYK